MAEHTVVILGGGTGGMVAARRLRHLLDAADPGGPGRPQLTTRSRRRSRG